jgi:hypothetical protein
MFRQKASPLGEVGGVGFVRLDAMNSRLGDEGLPLDSVEGYVAHVVDGKQVGESVFRRISPIAAILVWAGICDSAPGESLV